MKVKTKDKVETEETLNRGLSPNTEYWVIEIDDENYRVIDDDDEPCLYSKDLFIIIDASIPKDWIRKDYEDDEYHINPAQFEAYSEYFYEDYFDEDLGAIKIFKEYVEKYKKEYE